MKTTYSKDADALLIKLHDAKPHYGDDIGDGIIIHYDKNDHPVEVEILHAKRYLVNWLEQALDVKSISSGSA
ncbi:MAG: DUF2283 domain-containing protein [Cytophagales bacterium]|nr:DUF2283 domain-containing protein [Cytophagales bacterium]